MTRAAVVGSGAYGPLGLNALQVAMCLRAERMEPRTTPFRDKRKRLIGACIAAGIGHRVYGYQRMQALAQPALRQVCAQASGSSVALVVALPERGRADDDERFDSAFALDLATHCGGAIDQQRVYTVRQAHAGFAAAMARALELLGQGADEVIVGGVDSYYHPELLRALDEACRLHTLNALDGFIPGEGAAFLRLSAQPHESGDSHEAGCYVAHVAQGDEVTAAAIDDEAARPNRAEVMTRLLREHVSAETTTYVDLNGERHRLREWMMAMTRNGLSREQERRPAQQLGDLGAATGAIYAACIATYFRLGCAPSPRAAVALHTDGAPRGLVVMEAAS